MLKVLIVEDSFILADLLEDFLLSEGYDVCGIAGTVKEAVTLANLHNPDLAVFDYRLAGKEHGSDIRPLLNDRKSMGILYVSGDPLSEILTKADGDGYIHKPYGMQDLNNSLQIIHAIKTNGTITPSLIPKSLQFFKSPIDEWKSA